METILQDIFTDIGSDVLKESKIKAGFANTRIWPFNESVILSKFDKYM
jgi:hypothetical protein